MAALQQDGKVEAKMSVVTVTTQKDAKGNTKIKVS
jgi:hypothetical protein